jgi:DNA-binding response OmpR family regulator
LAKPFSLDELLARVRALFRRSGGQADSVLQVRDLRLDTVSREVTKGGKPVELTAREFSILEFLLYNKNRAVSRFSLAEHVWGDAFDPFSMSNFMDVHIKNLRKKIGDSGHGTIIRTIRGVGYIIKDEAE